MVSVNDGNPSASAARGLAFVDTDAPRRRKSGRSPEVPALLIEGNGTQCSRQLSLGPPESLALLGSRPVGTTRSFLFSYFEMSSVDSWQHIFATNLQVRYIACHFVSGWDLVASACVRGGPGFGLACSVPRAWHAPANALSLPPHLREHPTEAARDRPMADSSRLACACCFFSFKIATNIELGDFACSWHVVSASMWIL